MHHAARRVSVMVSFVAAALLLAAAPVAAQAELEDWQRDELEPLVDVVASALDGEIVPQEDPFELVPDLHQGHGRQYIRAVHADDRTGQRRR